MSTISASTRPTLKCLECGKEHGEVRKLVALTKHFICNECVDLCHEICHEGDTTSTIATADLEALRAKAEQAAQARFWIENVRRAVQQADEQISKRGTS